MKTRSQEARRLLASCRLCPRKCGANRLKGEPGYCRGGLLPKVASFNAHHGEEPPISGTRGSGTIFFAGCNLRCAYCQNWPISQQGQGREVDFLEMAGMMLSLQERGCHNINFVTPSHVVAQILIALEIATGRGLAIPLVYNTSGYDSPEALSLLDGVIDIYLPDIRYEDGAASLACSDAADYPAVNRASLKEMWRQTGPLQLDGDGVAQRGMLVRHLVLPNGLSQTREALAFLAKIISPEVYLSLMSQYFPAHRANAIPELARHITTEEYWQALDWLEEFGLENGWRQELDDSGGGPKERIVKDNH
ncbi:MAG: radical SAM protein [Candidatus Edwardsbacteria bacterium]|nr:radical SAM protein [Candidatus Edwardsbacteria bacterium]